MNKYFPHLDELTDELCLALKDKPMPEVLEIQKRWWTEYEKCKKETFLF